MKRSIICLAVLFFYIHASAQPAILDTIISRYRQFLIITDTSHSIIQSYPSVNDDGRWDDIDYADDQPAGWKIATHLERVRQMALTWGNKKSANYHSDKLLKNISLALSDWVEHRYKSKNWWHNEIGVPQFMRDIIILMQANLDNKLLAACLQVMSQLKVQGTGANLVWTARPGTALWGFDQ